MDKNLLTIKKYAFCFLGIVSVIFIYFIYPTSIFAQEVLDDVPFHIKTSPLPISISAAPGSTTSTNLSMTNAGTRAERIRVKLMKFGAYGVQGKPILAEREKGDDYFDWIRFSEDSFVVQPNQTKTITATISLPKEASFGYYYAVVFSQDGPPSVNETRKTALVGATASLILLEAKVPDAKREISVEEFSVDKIFFEYLPTKFYVKVKNSGNVHVVPFGNIFINSREKRDLAILPINSQSGNVLPASIRIFDVQWREGFPVPVDKVSDGKTLSDKNGNTLIDYKWDFREIDKFRIGRYTAILSLVYDDGVRDQTIESEVSFWVIPWKILLAIAIVLIFILIGVYTTIKTYLLPKSRK